MFKRLKIYIFMIAIILSSSIFAINVNFSDPTTTPTGTSPNLSDSGQSATLPQVATDSSGRYVYAVWERSDGTNTRIQVAVSSDYGVTWTDPSTTPGTTPNLSDSGQDASNAQVTTDSSGRYVYAVWQRLDGTNNRIQVAISSDFGVTWIDPTTTPGTSPNLSDSGQNASLAQVATDSTGRYVYAVWERLDGTNSRIQVAISSDFGVTWTDPTTTPGTSPNLSDSGQNAINAQVTTDSSGRYVYAAWQRSDGTNTRIQVVISSDYGVTWTDPTTTPGTTPNLSDSGQDAINAQVATDSSGRYVYAVWQNNTNFRIQVAISSDFGLSWTDPTTTPTGTTPNLSGQGAVSTQVTTDSSGRYVYAVWQLNTGAFIDIIQVAISSDFGETWTDPTTTPGTTPNLSDSGQNAINAQVTTDSSGRYVYAVWQRSDGTNNRIQAAISSDFGVTWTDPTTTPGTSPNLSDPGQSASFAQVTTDSSGRYVYAVWQRSDGTNTIIQVAIGVKSFFPIRNLTFRRV